jgi:4-amino-4-deoxy-L-arabinose transferase-like glycosyltransferase
MVPMPSMETNLEDLDLPSGGSNRTGLGQDLIWLTLIFGVLFFAHLGETALVNPDEGRYAEIPREMVVTGDYVTPRLNGVVYFEKPPLMYWAVAGMLKVFGPAEWAMRAPVALFGLAGVLLTYAAARSWRGRAAGILAACVLGSSLLFFVLGRILLLDMAVAVLMSATLYCFFLGVQSTGHRRLWLFHGLYAAAALATLTKGLIGFLLPGAVMFLWLLIFNQWKRLRPLYLPSGIFIFLLIAAPWHILVAQRNPQWAAFYFIREHWERFTTTTHERTAPWWYFGPVLVLGLFPWTGCVWGALRESVRGGWARRTENADAWFLVTWAAFIFLFFSKSQSKLIPYILPVLPPLAVLIGAWLADQWRAGEGRGLRTPMRIFGLMASALGAGLLVALFKPGVISNAEQAADLRGGGVLAALLLFLAAVVVPWLVAQNRWRPAAVATGVTLGGFYLVLGMLQDSIARSGTKELGLYVRSHAKPGDRIFHYYEFFHDFTFYAERSVGTVDWIGELEVDEDPVARSSGRFISRSQLLAEWNGPGRILVVARKRHVVATPESMAAAERAKEPVPLFGAPGFRYHLLAESPGHYLFSNQP